MYVFVVKYICMISKFTSPFVWLFSFFILLFVFTKLVGPIPFSVSSVTTSKSTTFDTQGEGKAAAKPDIASISVGIQAQSSSVKGVQEQINSVINKVSAGLKQLGVDSKDIQTRNYNINPNYDYSSGSQRITGYSANTTLLVKVRELDKVNEVIDTSTANGANQVSGITFDIEDKTKVENEARQKAVQEAKKKAEQAANIAGFKLGRIINYSENQPGQGRPIPIMIQAVGKAEGGTPTQVEPGSSEITISVTLSYEIQ